MTSSATKVGMMPAPPGVRPDFSGNRTGLQSQIIVVYSAMTAFSTVILGFRLYTRIFIRRTTGLDDFLIVLSWIGCVAWLAVCFHGKASGHTLYTDLTNCSFPVRFWRASLERDTGADVELHEDARRYHDSLCLDTSIDQAVLAGPFPSPEPGSEGSMVHIRAGFACFWILARNHDRRCRSLQSTNAYRPEVSDRPQPFHGDHQYTYRFLHSVLANTHAACIATTNEAEDPSRPGVCAWIWVGFPSLLFDALFADRL